MRADRAPKPAKGRTRKGPQSVSTSKGSGAFDVDQLVSTSEKPMTWDEYLDQFGPNTEKYKNFWPSTSTSSSGKSEESIEGEDPSGRSEAEAYLVEARKINITSLIDRWQWSPYRDRRTSTRGSALQEKVPVKKWTNKDWGQFVWYAANDTTPATQHTRTLKDLHRLITNLKDAYSGKTVRPFWGASKLNTLGIKFNKGELKIVGRPSWDWRPLQMSTGASGHRRHRVPWNLIAESVAKIYNDDSTNLIKVLDRWMPSTQEGTKDHKERKKLDAELERLSLSKVGGKKEGHKSENLKTILRAVFYMNSQMENLWVGGGRENIQLNNARVAIQKALDACTTKDDFKLLAEEWKKEKGRDLLPRAKAVGASILENEIEETPDADAESLTGAVWNHLWILPIDVGQSKADLERNYADESWMPHAQKLLDLRLEKNLRLKKKRQVEAEDFSEVFRWFLQGKGPSSQKGAIPDPTVPVPASSDSPRSEASFEPTGNAPSFSEPPRRFPSPEASPIGPACREKITSAAPSRPAVPPEIQPHESRTLESPESDSQTDLESAHFQENLQSWSYGWSEEVDELRPSNGFPKQVRSVLKDDSKLAQAREAWDVAIQGVTTLALLKSRLKKSDLDSVESRAQYSTERSILFNQLIGFQSDPLLFVKWIMKRVGINIKTGKSEKTVAANEIIEALVNSARREILQRATSP